jgi:hypothetical protein
VTDKIRSVCGPLIKDDEIGLKFRGLDGDWKDFLGIGFLAELQRRGVHVNIPKIGSRAA